ncbi:hypothetical protein [Bradyrhizobium sp. 1]|uniref:hypothetical protein n=1 Tax=Bradyrhizobium sp. 1 TaxID=241591 RepID=UPI001FFA304E|nr:hypothetical protein [Bradyrhizobium sp. 1]MCK1390966.1 hypothetical protein [Bradyrhizobium sp. 1]
MFFAFALTFAGATMIEAAGYFFKLNRNLIAGVRTMTGLWFAVAAGRQEEPRQPPAPTALTLGRAMSQGVVPA